MHIAFRTDASLEIGTGHVMRCLTLADSLREHGVESTFICRKQSGDLIGLISQRGHNVAALPSWHEKNTSNFNDASYDSLPCSDWVTDADDTKKILTDMLSGQLFNWLIVDHYALDISWEQAMRSSVRRIMVIDDLANRSHDCDLLLDQNLGRVEHDYSDLLNSSAITLIGPKFSLLRSEFAAMREKSLHRRVLFPNLKHLLIAMGGVDKENVTEKILDTLNGCDLPRDFHITVVMGLHAPWILQVQAKAKNMIRPTKVLVGVANIEQVMSDSDLAIGAAGGMAWERCSLGLPSLLIVLARNQSAGTTALHDNGAAIALSGIEQIPHILQNLLKKNSGSELLLKMVNAAANITDGEGCKRVISHGLLKYE